MLLGCVALGASLSSCNDWLTLYPMDKIVEENFWEDKNDLESVRNQAYKSMISSANMMRYLIWGEARSDNFRIVDDYSSSELGYITNINLKPTNTWYDWSSIYSTINYCNKVIQHGPEIMEKDKSFSEGDWEAIRAEMYALRALNYFYLTRTYDSVPLVLEAINEDTEVKPIKATSQKVVLDTLITQLEEICEKNMMAQSYGNDSDNKGFITDKAVYTILADIYLWRASLLELNSSQQAMSDYARCAELCTKVLQRMDEEYKTGNVSGNGKPGSSTDEDNPYHLYLNDGVEGQTVTDGAYYQIFGKKNSRESIFELQFDSKNLNGAVSTLFACQGVNGQIRVGNSLKSTIAQNQAENAGDNLFYKTDFRRLESMTDGTEQLYITKYAASDVQQKKTTKNNEDILEIVNKTLRTQNLCDANWIFYRISDVLLMKAEALCRLNRGEQDLKEAFSLVEQIFNRSNPYANATQKLKQTNYNTQAALEKLIFRERQREFIGEGKRWFDVVRYALRKENASEEVFNMISSVFESSVDRNTASNKYMQGISVLYAPIYENELKANPLLNQNPIWDQGSSIERN